MRRASAVVPFFFLLPVVTGCLHPEPEPLSPAETEAFRKAAVKALEEAAFGDSPTLRMAAIEAFKEVAPKQAMDLLVIPLNIDNLYPGASFAALMAAGELRERSLIEKIRTRAESADPNVRMAAIFALHRLGDRSRTGELADLLRHPNARVRANAALVLGRLNEKRHARLLRSALRQEQKTVPKMQILESLAALGDRKAIERLIFDGYSEYPDQATLALMMLANAKAQEAEDVFLTRLEKECEFPEVPLQAARGLALLGSNQGMSLALKQLFFDSPRHVSTEDPADRQIDRVRGLAALALEVMAEPKALAFLKRAFYARGQSAYVRIAIARAAIRTIDRARQWRAAETAAAGPTSMPSPP